MEQGYFCFITLSTVSDDEDDDNEDEDEDDNVQCDKLNVMKCYENQLHAPLENRSIL